MRLSLKLKKLTDDELQAKTTYFKEQIANGQSVLDIQVEAFAVVREAAKRVVGMRHFDVQLIGGMVLTEGSIAEMPTGEGKTLSLPFRVIYVHLKEKGFMSLPLMIILPHRDRELIGGIHEFLGLTVGLNLPMMDPESKKIAYEADITYGVGN